MVANQGFYKTDLYSRNSGPWGCDGGEGNDTRNSDMIRCWNSEDESQVSLDRDCLLISQLLGHEIIIQKLY